MTTFSELAPDYLIKSNISVSLLKMIKGAKTHYIVHHTFQYTQHTLKKSDFVKKYSIAFESEGFLFV